MFFSVSSSISAIKPFIARSTDASGERNMVFVAVTPRCKGGLDLHQQRQSPPVLSGLMKDRPRVNEGTWRRRRSIPRVANRAVRGGACTRCWMRCWLTPGCLRAWDGGRLMYTGEGGMAVLGNMDDVSAL